MLGEIDFNDLFHPSEDGLNYEEMTYFFFVIFLIVMSIVLMNLLVALAVDDVGTLQSHAKLEKIACQVRMKIILIFLTSSQSQFTTFEWLNLYSTLPVII